MKKTGFIPKLGLSLLVGAMPYFLGCSSKPISISGDGQYISYASTEKGNARFVPDRTDRKRLESNINVDLINYDVKNKSVKDKIQIEHTPTWITNSSEHLAYTFYDEDAIGDQSIVFINNNRKKIIKSSDYPVLSKSNDCLAYLKSENDGELVLDYFKKGFKKETRLKAIPCSFSPNLEKLLYAMNSETNGENDGRVILGTYTLKNSQKRTLVRSNINIQKNLSPGQAPFFPQWIDNDKILYQDIDSESYNEKTTEIFVVNNNRDKIRITNNNKEEVSPMYSNNGEVFYVSLKRGQGFGSAGDVHFSKNVKGFWKEYETDISAKWTRVSNDQLVYLDENDNVKMLPLEEVMKNNSKDVYEIKKDVELYPLGNLMKIFKKD